VEPAAETLKLNAPALALGPFLHSFNLPGVAQGTVQAQLNASAKGDTLPAILGSVTGRLGLASVNGVVDGAVIGKLFGDALQSVGLPASLASAPGPVALRCAALRLDANNGSGTVKALAIDSSRLLMQGGGTLNFADETLALVLKPRLRVGGTNVTVPVQVGGTFLAPSYSVAPQSAVAAAAQTAVGLGSSPLQQVLGGNTLLGKVAGALTGNNSEADICPAALSLARMGQPGPAPAPASSTAAPSGTSQPRQTGPRSLLNGLLGQ
jgi:AsmA protein